MMGVGLVGLLAKMFKWDDSAMFFDGSSLGALPFPFPYIPKLKLKSKLYPIPQPRTSSPSSSTSR